MPCTIRLSLSDPFRFAGLLQVLLKICWHHEQKPIFPLANSEY